MTEFLRKMFQTTCGLDISTYTNRVTFFFLNINLMCFRLQPLLQLCKHLHKNLASSLQLARSNQKKINIFCLFTPFFEDANNHSNVLTTVSQQWCINIVCILFVFITDASVVLCVIYTWSGFRSDSFRTIHLCEGS